MVIFLVLFYLTLVTLAVWYFVSASSLLRWGQKTKRYAWVGLNALRPTFSKREPLPLSPRKPISRLYFSWQQHRLYLFIAGGIVLFPILVAFLLRSNVEIEDFSDISAQETPVISALLQGEQLVPPPALPPESFLTFEVQAERPEIQYASRDWALLHTDFRQRLLLTFKIMEREHGYQMVMLEGYRSPERQDKLAQQGPNITNAKAFQSYHQYGLAADSAFLRNGKVVISEKDPWAMQGYKLYGQVAESVGLGWGGRWKLMDFGHVELPEKGVLGKPTT